MTRQQGPSDDTQTDRASGNGQWKGGKGTEPGQADLETEGGATNGWNYFVETFHILENYN